MSSPQKSPPTSPVTSPSPVEGGEKAKMHKTASGGWVASPDWVSLVGQSWYWWPRITFMFLYVLLYSKGSDAKTIISVKVKRDYAHRKYGELPRNFHIIFFCTYRYLHLNPSFLSQKKDACISLRWLIQLWYCSWSQDFSAL